MKQHETGRASRYTRARLPVALTWTRRVRTWSKALREEWRLKRLTRSEKEALISGAAPRVRP
ncbi:MAG TPA: GIY-YIG nuclease family protein [Vicinamibacteria bacterium]|nr:GIY-YIG nuclease family protein [Vicinamibacteria bacterium]